MQEVYYLANIECPQAANHHISKTYDVVQGRIIIEIVTSCAVLLINGHDHRDVQKQEGRCCEWDDLCV